MGEKETDAERAYSKNKYRGSVGTQRRCAVLPIRAQPREDCTSGIFNFWFPISTGKIASLHWEKSFWEITILLVKPPQIVKTQKITILYSKFYNTV